MNPVFSVPFQSYVYLFPKAKRHLTFFSSTECNISTELIILLHFGLDTGWIGFFIYSVSITTASGIPHPEGFPTDENIRAGRSPADTRTAWKAYASWSCPLKHCWCSLSSVWCPPVRMHQTACPLALYTWYIYDSFQACLSAMSIASHSKRALSWSRQICHTQWLRMPSLPFLLILFFC